MHSENIWFSWSIPSKYWEHRKWKIEQLQEMTNISYVCRGRNALMQKFGAFNSMCHNHQMISFFFLEAFLFLTFPSKSRGKHISCGQVFIPRENCSKRKVFPAAKENVLWPLTGLVFAGYNALTGSPEESGPPVFRFQLNRTCFHHPPPHLQQI